MTDSINYDWFVTLTFEVDLAELNLTPGSGELPEELCAHMIKRGMPVTLKPLSEDGSVRSYFYTSQVRAYCGAEAVEVAKANLSWIPSFELTQSKASIVEDVTSKPVGQPVPDPPSATPAEDSATGWFRVSIDFLSRIPVDIIRNRASLLTRCTLWQDEHDEMKFHVGFDLHSFGDPVFTRAMEFGRAALIECLCVPPAAPGDVEIKKVRVMRSAVLLRRK